MFFLLIAALCFFVGGSLISYGYLYVEEDNTSDKNKLFSRFAGWKRVSSIAAGIACLGVMTFSGIEGVDHLMNCIEEGIPQYETVELYEENDAVPDQADIQTDLDSSQNQAAL